MVPGAVWAVTVAVWAVTASMPAVTSYVSDIAASMCDAQVPCGLGLLQPLHAMRRRYVGCCSLHAGFHSLYVGCHRRHVGCCIIHARHVGAV